MTEYGAFDTGSGSHSFSQALARSYCLHVADLR